MEAIMFVISLGLEEFFFLRQGAPRRIELLGRLAQRGSIRLWRWHAQGQQLRG